MLAFLLAAIQDSPPVEGYELVWRDEFEGQALDPEKWKPWAIGPRRDAFNVADAPQVRDGKLIITTRRNGDRVETGGAWTQGIYEPTYGYFEARIRFPKEVGHWGAFWLNCGGMGNPVGDPKKAGVEMDIVEFHQKMKSGTQVQHNLHWDGYGDAHKSRGRSVDLAGASEEFHTYGMEWSPEGYRFFVDGKETFTQVGEGAVVASGRPQYLILSIEVGTWAGSIKDAKLPDSMEIDWVRVWQKKP